MSKFKEGDHVMIAEDLGPMMSHFTADEEAIVEDVSYSLYGLCIKGHGYSAWYYEDQLTLIEANRPDLMEKWEAEREAELAKYKDIDWIFENGHLIVANMEDYPWMLIAQTLANAVDIDDLWGNRGEGIDLFTNSQTIMGVAESFLNSNDKHGWINENWKFTPQTTHIY